MEQRAPLQKMRFSFDSVQQSMKVVAICCRLSKNAKIRSTTGNLDGVSPPCPAPMTANLHLKAAFELGGGAQ